MKSVDTKLLFTSEKVNVGGYEVGLRRNGAVRTQTIVLVHGIGVSEKYFRPLADILGAEYNVIAVDMPGYGETDEPDHVLNLKELTEVLESLFDQLGIEQPVVIGHSMGCQVAARLGAKKVASKVILISPTINARERKAWLQFVRLMQDVPREPFWLNMIVLLDYIKFGPRHYLETQHHMMRDAIEKTLAACERPVLILHGTRDPIVPRDWVLALEKQANNARLVEVEGGQHNFHYNYAGQVAQSCIDFIKH